MYVDMMHPINYLITFIRDIRQTSESSIYRVTGYEIRLNSLTVIVHDRSHIGLLAVISTHLQLLIHRGRPAYSDSALKKRR